MQDEVLFYVFCFFLAKKTSEIPFFIRILLLCKKKFSLLAFI